MLPDNEHVAAAESILLSARTFEVSYKVIVRVALGLALSTTVLATTTAWLALSRPKPRYFSTTSDGQLLPRVPLHSAAEVSNFAVMAVTMSHNCNFANYGADVNNALQYFTKPTGWNQFVEAAEKSQMLDLVQSRRLHNLAVVNNAVIVREGINHPGVYE